MPKNTNNDPRPTRVLNPQEWAKLRESLADAWDLQPLAGPAGDPGYRRVLKPDAPAAVEVIFGEGGVSVVDATTGRMLDRPTAGRGGGALAPMLRANIFNAASIAQANRWNIVLLSQSYIRALTRFAMSSGVVEGPEGEERLVELCDEVLQHAEIPSVYVLIQSQFSPNPNNYSTTGVDLVGAELPHVAVDAERAERAGSDPYVVPYDPEAAFELAQQEKD
jgi:hypothetical protein